MFKKFCDKNNIILIDLLEVYKISAKKIWQKDDRSHPNEHGLKLCAEKIVETLIEQKIVLSRNVPL